MFKNMPWSSHEEGQKNHGEEESLTSILHGNQRGELTLFIASITAAMRKTIESNFDASVCRLIDPSLSLSLIVLGWPHPEGRASEELAIRR